MIHLDSLDWAGVATFSVVLVVSLLGWAFDSYRHHRYRRIRMRARRRWPREQHPSFFVDLKRFPEDLH